MIKYWFTFCANTFIYLHYHLELPLDIPATKFATSNIFVSSKFVQILHGTIFKIFDLTQILTYKVFFNLNIIIESFPKINLCVKFELLF